MVEKFGKHPEVKWVAMLAPKALGDADKLAMDPDLSTFRLVRFFDFRDKPGPIMGDFSFRLMVTDGKTNIFIDGPDAKLDALIKKLPSYKDRSWREIRTMTLDRDFTTCANAFSPLCDPWIRENCVLAPLGPGQPAPELDFVKSDEICANCDNFSPKR